MSAAYETLLLRRDGPVATVTLARPQSRNALNAALVGELTRCMEELADDVEVRVVVLGGEGSAFCAGADIAYMQTLPRLSYEENLEEARRLSGVFMAVDEIPKPVVGRVHGPAVGGGAGLVAACDVAVASEAATFSFSEVRIGLAPATIAPLVVSKVGLSQARALFLSGERFDARRAREIGLIHDVSPQDELDSAVRRRVEELLKGGPVAQAEVKDLLRELVRVEGARESMVERIARLRVGEEGQEGFAAFLEKRTPRWGRS